MKFHSSNKSMGKNKIFNFKNIKEIFWKAWIKTS